MNNIDQFINSVQCSRKRTGILYCSVSFGPIIQSFQLKVPEIQLLDCTDLYQGSVVFSAADLLNRIEQASKNKPSIVANIEAFIVANSRNFSEQLARLLIVREPLKPLFFLFYSKRIYVQFRNLYEVKELNQQNILEL
jgi:hypothetical protein